MAQDNPGFSLGSGRVQHDFLSQNALASREDFLLFGVLFEATMIDPAVASKPISFEISIGVWLSLAPEGDGFEGGHSCLISIEAEAFEGGVWLSACGLLTCCSGSRSCRSQGGAAAQRFQGWGGNRRLHGGGAASAGV